MQFDIIESLRNNNNNNPHMILVKAAVRNFNSLELLGEKEEPCQGIELATMRSLVSLYKLRHNAVSENVDEGSSHDWLNQC